VQKATTYLEAIALKYPEQVVIAIAKDRQGKYNPITLGWTMVVSHDPPMMAIAVGKTRYSLEAIRSAGEFVIAFPSEHQAKETLLYGTKSGRDADKLADAGAKTAPAKKIDCVLLWEAVANFECELVSETEAGDHVVFIGQIVCSHVNETPLNRLYTVGQGYKMGGLPRSAGGSEDA
jgi:flavin reductase (DIM6/NTAB) family NADH-FMN oxidoreductase RutF